MQISVHEIKDQVNVSIILSSDNVLQSNDILMTVKLLQENDLSESSLRVCCILKRIKVLFQGNDVFGFFVNCFPNNTVSSLAYTLKGLANSWWRWIIKVKFNLTDWELPNFCKISYFLRTWASISSVIFKVQNNNSNLN